MEDDRRRRDVDRNRWRRISDGRQRTHRHRDRRRAIADIIYAMVEAARPTTGRIVRARSIIPIHTGLYRSIDAGRTWTKQNDYDDRPFYYSQVRVDPTKCRAHVISRRRRCSCPIDGGKTSRFAAAGRFTPTRTASGSIPKIPTRIAFAHDGGVGISFDGGGTYFSPMNMPITQFYSVGPRQRGSVQRVRRQPGQRRVLRTESSTMVS